MGKEGKLESSQAITYPGEKLTGYHLPGGKLSQVITLVGEKQRVLTRCHPQSRCIKLKEHYVKKKYPIQWRCDSGVCKL